MSEPNKAVTDPQPDTDRPANEIPPLGWRRSSVGVGLFVMICALFAKASGNQVASFLGNLLFAVALFLIAVPIVISIVNAVSSTIKRLKGTTTTPGS